ncbi:MAG TPA: flavodoxin [Dysgonamonadaceae bacterium]|jgi:flavodoxin I|nr:flavodoxin [Dysgonamonadaceae bacterium]
MKKIAILYGTSGGNTESIANRIKEKFDGDADLFDVGNVSVADVQPYRYLILGASTTGMGDLQDDWDSFLLTFSTKMDFTDKVVAIFGLGDSASFSSSFAESIYVLHDDLKDKVKIVGAVPDVGYTYDDSSAVADGMWLGLALDEDNEYDESEDRITQWVEQLKKEFV